MTEALYQSKEMTSAPRASRGRQAKGTGVRTALAGLFLLSGMPFAQAAGPTDPQIAHIAYTAGELDIAGAKQALAKSNNKDVRAFAEGMVNDHTAVNKQALDLVKKLKVTPEDNDTSRALSKAAEDKRAELAKLDGAERPISPMRLPIIRP